MCVCACDTSSSFGLLDRIGGHSVGVKDEQEGAALRKGGYR